MVMLENSTIGVTITKNVQGGRIGGGNFAYPSPYQIKYAGLLLDLKPATDYDSGGVSQLVGVPAAAGARVKGWAFKTTARNDLLPGASLQFYPLDANLGGSGYAEDEKNFGRVTVVPLIPDQLIGVPVAQFASIALNAEIASAGSGFASTATSGQVVIGNAEYPVDNSTGAAGAKYVFVRVNTPYTKA